MEHSRTGIKAGNGIYVAGLYGSLKILLGTSVRIFPSCSSTLLLRFVRAGAQTHQQRWINQKSKRLTITLRVAMRHRIFSAWDGNLKSQPLICTAVYPVCTIKMIYIGPAGCGAK